MIGGFRDKNLSRLYEGEEIAKWANMREQLITRLRVLDAADSLEALRRLRSNHLEALSGDLKGLYSIRVNRQWRLCFKWPSGAEGPSEVRLADYH